MLAAVLVAGLGIAFPLAGSAAPAAPTVAAAPLAAAVPTTASSGGRTLTANPSTDLAVNGAQITVSGSGFTPTSGGIFVAVCTSAQTAGGVRPGQCIGGNRPNASLNRDYAHFVDPNRTGGPGGGVTAPLTGGDFTQYTLTLTSATGTPNCQTQACSLWAFSDDESDPSQDVSIPLAFVAAPTSPSPSSTTTSPTAPSTAVVASVATQDVAAGAQQTVVFTGFRPNEVLGVELFPPTSTQAVTPPGTFGSDGNGNATVTFTVPTTVSPGAVRLQVTGRSSGIVGVAEFQVVAPPTTASSTPASTTSSTPTTSASPTSSSVVASSTPATSSSAVLTPASDSGSSLWWLWLLLAVLVIAGIVTGIVLWRRKQEQDREREQQQRDVEAAAAQQQAAERDRMLGQQPTQAYPPPADPYGLLAGRDPADYGQGPTEVIPPGQGPRTQGWPPPSNAPTQYIPPPGSQDQTRYIPPAGPGRGPAGPPGSDAPTQFVPPYQPPGRRPQGPPPQRPQEDPERTQVWRPEDDDRTQTWRPDDEDPRGGPRR
ncbi:hypothetical protein FDO65_08810 [Nakamurella flava]|uniref:IPT/TIG domain-containing protein n=1 Tax=Nakamurella flava TaxID=2576308 RepID=A0A4U6QNJ8_9ACTN|nr:hypothetical protein [Nakamurella flava]TKV61642.1 hypothetical protein FDO65_08810 [Nakamurella flava]